MASAGLAQTIAVPELTLPRDLSPWGMFQAADRVVKAVMIGLALASLVTWTIWFAKSLEILAANLRLRRGLKVVLAADGLGDAERALAGRSGPLAAMVRAAQAETAAAPAALTHGDAGGFLARVGSHLGRIEAQAARRLNFGVGILATIGATAPFVGLLGTVVGVINAFVGIASTGSGGIGAVSAGIAEALVETALGLFVAIPAVWFYNYLSGRLEYFNVEMDNSSSEMVDYFIKKTAA
jgi:biopolymer transport protein ExbB